MSLYALLSVTYALLVTELRQFGMSLTEAVDAVHERFHPPTAEQVAAVAAEEKRVKAIERGRAQEALMVQMAGMQGGRTIE